jgi:hypothetical protein
MTDFVRDRAGERLRRRCAVAFRFRSHAAVEDVRDGRSIADEDGGAHHRVGRVAQLTGLERQHDHADDVAIVGGRRGVAPRDRHTDRGIHPRDF